MYKKNPRLLSEGFARGERSRIGEQRTGSFQKNKGVEMEITIEEVRITYDAHYCWEKEVSWGRSRDGRRPRGSSSHKKVGAWFAKVVARNSRRSETFFFGDQEPAKEEVLERFQNLWDEKLRYARAHRRQKNEQRQWEQRVVYTKRALDGIEFPDEWLVEVGDNELFFLIDAFCEDQDGDRRLVSSGWIKAPLEEVLAEKGVPVRVKQEADGLIQERKKLT